MAKTTNDASLVGVGQPKATGAVFVAPKGTALPASAAAELGPEFECMGYISEDGITIGESRETSEIKEWGGNVVYKSQTSYQKTVQFKCIEHSEAAIKARFGDDNIIKDTEGKMIGYRHNSKALGHRVLVIDTVISDSKIQRDIYPDAMVNETGDITYKAGEVIGYDMTFTTFPVTDSKGNSDNGITYWATVDASAVANG